MTANEIISRLDLQPHPEGGWYRETWKGPEVGGRASGTATAQRLRLGPDVLGDEAVQAVVPAGCWQTARSVGDWTLVSCTVSPGFRFEGFELAPPGWELPSGG